MNKKFCVPLVFAAGLLMFLSACDRAPVQKLVNPTVYTNGWESRVWVLYDDEKRTGGALAMLTTMEGQSLDLSSRDNPHSGQQCIKYSWDGSEVTQYSPFQREFLFTGFSFIVADNISNWDSVSRDLTPGGFTKLTFWARGSLNSNVSLKISRVNPDKSVISEIYSASEINDNWQPFTFPKNTRTVITNINEYVTIALVYAPIYTPAIGNGGTVFIDDIQLEK